MRTTFSARAELLAGVISKVSTDESVPVLGINISLRPGECWLFHPRLANLRWWWDEIVTYSDALRDLIIKAWASYIHEQCFLVLLPKVRDDAYRQSLLRYCFQLRKRRTHDIADATAKLFSLREKTAWLAYELSGIYWNVRMETRRVSFHSVLDELSKVEKKYPRDSRLKELKHALERFSDENIEVLFEFRNSFVHRIGVALDDPTPPLMIETEPERWDSVPTGRIRSRYFLHLILHAWQCGIGCLKELAAMPSPAEFLCIESQPQEDRKLPSLLNYTHSGVRIGTRFGILKIRCMKECRGFLGELWLDPPLDKSEATILTLGDEISDIFINCMPDYEPERHRGHVKILNIGDKDRLFKVTFLLTTEFAAEQRKTVGQRTVDIATSELKNSQIERISTEDLDLSKIYPTCDWPSDVRQSYARLLREGRPSTLAIWKPATSGKRTKLHVCFRSSQDFAWDQKLVCSANETIDPWLVHTYADDDFLRAGAICPDEKEGE
jgi:hypothetical protein